MDTLFYYTGVLIWTMGGTLFIIWAGAECLWKAIKYFKLQKDFYAFFAARNKERNNHERI